MLWAICLPLRVVFTQRKCNNKTLQAISHKLEEKQLFSSSLFSQSFSCLNLYNNTLQAISHKLEEKQPLSGSLFSQSFSCLNLCQAEQSRGRLLTVCYIPTCLRLSLLQKLLRSNDQHKFLVIVYKTPSATS